MVGDGAYGTALAHLLHPGERVDELCGRAPERVIELHEAFISAGARRIQTNSFLVWQMPPDRRRAAYEASLSCAREAARSSHVAVEVVATVGPGLGGSISSWRNELELVLACEPDAVNVETLTDPATVLAVLEALRREVVRIPITISMSVNPQAPVASWGWITQLEPFEGISLALNCCTGALPELRAPLESMVTTYGSVGLAPSAGLPEAPLPPGAWATAVRELAEGLPIDRVAGCCGATTAHIAALAARFPAP